MLWQKLSGYSSIITSSSLEHYKLYFLAHLHLFWAMYLGWLYIRRIWVKHDVCPLQLDMVNSVCAFCIDFVFLAVSLMMHMTQLQNPTYVSTGPDGIFFWSLKYSLEQRSLSPVPFAPSKLWFKGKINFILYILLGCWSLQHIP